MKGSAIYTDGAVTRNGAPNALAAWGIVHVLDGKEHFRSNGLVVTDPYHHDYVGAERHTNNTAEISAVYWAMRTAIALGVERAVIVSDSKHAVAMVKGEMSAHKNKALVRQARALYIENAQRFRFRWVKGHAGHRWNELADKLAGEALGRTS